MATEVIVEEERLFGFNRLLLKPAEDVNVVTRGGMNAHGWVSVVGMRKEMEDAVCVRLGFAKDMDFYGVYDGHGGAVVANACREGLHRIIAEEMNKATSFDWNGLMVKCFTRMDEEANSLVRSLPTARAPTTGSTAVIALLGAQQIVVANCGDSRAVLFRRGSAVPVSDDHRPNIPGELDRVEAAGGKVVNWNGAHRVMGILATSRSIGDEYLKPYVTCCPDVRFIRRDEDDEFLILASDGLWDVLSSDSACRVVKRCIEGQVKGKTGAKCRRRSAGEAAAVLVDVAASRGSRDNISVVIVRLTLP